MGDNTKQARAFMRQCHSALSELNTAPVSETVEAPCPHVTAQALADVQSAAKRNHARAIYRAAQQTLNALHASQTLTPYITTLSGLIAQYEEGLIELEGFEAEAEAEATSQSSVATQNVDKKEADIIPLALSDEARQARAFEALSSTLSHANDSERPALATLLSFSSGVAPQTELENIETEKADTQDSAAEAKTVPLIQTAVVPTPVKNEALISGDSFISEVIQFGLTQARQNKLTLSLSYDVDALSLTEQDALTLRTRLEFCIGALVHQLAAKREDQPLAHIDISYEKKALHILANTPPLPKSILEAAPYFEATEQRANGLSGHLQLILSDLSTSGTSEKTVNSSVKMPVDEGIAARLGALMETETVYIQKTGTDATLINFEPIKAV